MSHWFFLLSFFLLALACLWLFKRYQSLGRRHRQLRFLHSINASLNTSMELSSLSESLSQHLIQELALSQVSLLLWQPGASQLVMEHVAGSNPDAWFRGQSFRAKDSLSAQVLAEGKSIYLPNRSEEEKCLLSQEEEKISGSWICLPLSLGGQALGLLHVAREQNHAFDFQDRQTLELLAQQVAMALENSLLYAKVLKLSRVDELTQVHNRRHFQEMIEMEFSRAKRFDRPLSLLMLDVDYFKKVNDNFGHLQGDRILVSMARLLASHLREVDTLARYGGEEFAVILPNTELSNASKVAKKLSQLIEASSPSWFEEKKQKLTVSVGLTAMHPEMASVEDLINEADLALYEAKEAGRNRVVVFGGPRSQLLSLAKN